MALPEIMRGALARMDEGRFRAMNKIRAVCGLAKELSEEEQNERMDRSDALRRLKGQDGWALVLKRVAERKNQLFLMWMNGSAENVAGLRERVSELEDLLRWVEGEIEAGVAVERALEQREGKD